MTTTAALLSEPRIVPDALRTIPSSPITGSIVGLRRHRVRVRAEEDRRPVPAVRRRDAAVDVPGVTVELRGRVVFVPLQPEIVEVGDHAIGDRALSTRGARQRAELEEEIDERGYQQLLHCGHPTRA